MQPGTHEDDIPVGRVVTRREAIRLFKAPAILWLAGCRMLPQESVDAPVVGSCVVTPQLTAGPFYLDETLNRADIRSDTASGAISTGTPLSLEFKVSRVAGDECVPVEAALVDVWHADAMGNYSGVGRMAGKDFLRGYQVTGANGVAHFDTIFPGWYPGRAVHIHFKVRSSASSSSAYEFTSQLFFQDSFSAGVYEKAPYNERGKRFTRNSSDGIYRRSGGQTLVAATSAERGCKATLEVALNIA